MLRERERAALKGVVNRLLSLCAVDKLKRSSSFSVVMFSSVTAAVVSSAVREFFEKPWWPKQVST